MYKVTLYLKLAISLFAIFSSIEVSAQVYTYMDENGITVFTNKKPDTNKYNVKNHGCFGTCITGVSWETTPLNSEAFSEEVDSAAANYGVDKALVRAIIHAESWFQPNAVSKAGAQGLMQLMPATQARFNVIDAHDPSQNINAGVEYLAWLLKEFSQDKSKVIAAYNAGENAIKRYKGIPPFSETREYLRRVTILYNRYQSVN